MSMETFEDRLLTRLKEELPEPAPSPERRQARRPVITPRRVVAAAAVFATVTSVVVLDPGVDPSPAYAVTKNPDGTVTVVARDFIDGERLESDLRDAGVRADVRDADGLLGCEPDRLEYERKLRIMLPGGPIAEAKVITWGVRKGGLSFRIYPSRMRPAERLRIELDPIRPEEWKAPPSYRRSTPLWLQVKVALTDARGVPREEPLGFGFAKTDGIKGTIVCALK